MDGSSVLQLMLKPRCSLLRLFEVRHERDALSRAQLGEEAQEGVGAL